MERLKCLMYILLGFKTIYMYIYNVGHDSSRCNCSLVNGVAKSNISCVVSFQVNYIILNESRTKNHFMIFSEILFKHRLL